jgi:hypothetical protein
MDGAIRCCKLRTVHNRNGALQREKLAQWMFGDMM